MSEDYIRDELQKATAEYIKAVRLALARTKEAQRAAGGMGVGLRYLDMNKIQRFHEDRRVSLEAFLHNLESCHHRGMIISFEDWIDTTLYPRMGANLEVLLGKEMSEDERERIRRSFRPADSGSEGGAGAALQEGGAAGGGAAEVDSDDTPG